MTPERHARIKELFLAACRMPPEQRSGWLKERCGDDANLRNEIQRLLDQHSADLSGDSADATADSAQNSVRFQSGDVVAGRFRIVSRLGAGGMGEVFRAEDLVLDQTIALKFLSPEHAANPIWLSRFRHELRLARQITHPYICRVFDIGEVADTCFISMEYVDGEDLSSLLRRIGRLPSNKAADIARQTCAGLAAAHDCCVLHRDLKPQNIMLDGRGRVRITDFGIAELAGHVDRHDIRSGTPQYMAPEQISGREVTERSDLYSLGLILYEIFTGKPAFGENRPRALTTDEDPQPASPSSIVSDLDPDIEQLIVDCLQMDPDARPASALEVAARLPGADLLAAALEAGRTPSPELVAAAGRTYRLDPVVSWSCAALFVVLLTGVCILGTRTYFAKIARQVKPPAVLADIARDTIGKLGYESNPADFAYQFTNDLGLSKAGSADDAAESTRVLAVPMDPKIAFWYRQSADPLVPESASSLVFGNARVTQRDPPLDDAGMISLVLGSDGRLLSLDAMPAGESANDVTLSALVQNAGIDVSRMTPAPPRQLPRTFADRRQAWCGRVDDHAESQARVEAAAALGQLVHLSVTNESNLADLPRSFEARFRQHVVSVTRFGLFLVLVPVGAVLARRHSRSGRGDREGATRLAIFIGSIRMAAWLLGGHHVPDLPAELQLAGFALVGALAESAIVWILYMALEPYVRRFWPHSLIAWTRLLAGGARDPLVGRSVLIGGLIGALWALLFEVDFLAPTWFGIPSRESIRGPEILAHLIGARGAVVTIIDAIRNAVYQGLLILLLVALLRAALGRPFVAAFIAAVVVAPMIVPSGSHPSISWATIGIGCVGTAVWALTRFGIVAVIVAGVVVRLLVFFPFTVDFRLWYADLSVFAFLSCVTVAGWGLAMSIRGTPLQKRAQTD